jgi:nicotinic acid mononucleotide adenylyltransferase
VNTIDAVTEIRDLPEPPQVYVVCTGAGAGLQKLLWDVPGCSKFLVGAAFPYAAEDTADFLGFEPERACTETTAIQLAMEAYSRAWKPGNKRTIGVGMTAVVGTTREHKGDHRVYIATVSEDKCTLLYAVLNKSKSTGREDEGETCDLLGLNALRNALGLPLVPITQEIFDWYELSDPIDIRDVFFLRPFTNLSHRRASEYAHFPGAFNPPHEGHFGIAEQIEEEHRRPVLFSIEAEPPHKPALTVPEMLQRAKMLKGHSVIFTRGQPLYEDKIASGVKHIVIGADALLRLMTWDNKTPEENLAPFVEERVRFYVVGREIPDRGYTTMRDLLNDETLSLNSDFLFYPVKGRWDISSTDVREGRA